MTTNSYIVRSDYDASVFREILDQITREDEATVEVCEERAIDELTSYLSARYDCDKLFAQRGPERSNLVLMMCIDIAVYHMFCIGNPVKLSQVRKDRYERAIDWAKAVNRGKVNIHNAPLYMEDQRKNARYRGVSNPKRTNHY